MTSVDRRHEGDDDRHTYQLNQFIHSRIIVWFASSSGSDPDRSCSAPLHHLRPPTALLLLLPHQIQRASANGADRTMTNDERTNEPLFTMNDDD